MENLQKMNIIRLLKNISGMMSAWWGREDAFSSSSVRSSTVREIVISEMQLEVVSK